MLLRGWSVPAEHTLYGCCRDAMAFGDLPQALSLAAVTPDGLLVQGQRISSDVPAFEARPSHAAANPLDDQAALELGDGADDHHDGAAQRAARVDLFAEA